MYGTDLKTNNRFSDTIELSVQKNIGIYNNNVNPSHDDVLTVANRPSPTARIYCNSIIIMHDTHNIIIPTYTFITFITTRTVSMSGWGGWLKQFSI